MRERAITRLPEAIAFLRDETARFRRDPYAIFGHSLGALLAFELTRALRRAGEPLPQHLVVSGCAAPHRLPHATSARNRDDATLLRLLGDLSGTPRALLQDAELLALTLPALRADLALRDDYVCLPEAPLPLPVTAFAGERDAHAPPSSVRNWRTHTAARYAFQTFSGGHFFLREDPAFFHALAAAVAPPPARRRAPSGDRAEIPRHRLDDETPRFSSSHGTGSRTRRDAVTAKVMHAAQDVHALEDQADGVHQ